jgi:hypothetical protein
LRCQILTTGWFAIQTVLYSRGRGVEGREVVLSFDVPMAIAAGLLWLCAIDAVRISMSLMLLRLGSTRVWSCVLYTLIGIQVCLIIVVLGVQLSMCRPLSSLWDPTPDTKCIPAGGMMVYAYVYAGKDVDNGYLSLMC